jgi:hypothetical protein
MDHADQLLMRSAMQAEFLLAHTTCHRPKVPWFEGDPPAVGTYLIRCLTIDAAPYVRCCYWDREWRDLPGHTRVKGWWWVPAC